MQIIEDKIKTYITTLSLLSSLNLEDFDNDDDITTYIPNCIMNAAIVLGNVFDEELIILIKKTKLSISELYRKNILVINIFEIFNSKRNINKIINDNMNLILNTDSYEYSYCDIENELYSKVDEYFNSQNFKLINVNKDTLEDVINYIIFLIDKAYELSKDLSTSIIDKISYMYNYKNANLSELSFYAIDGILYLVKYYIVLFKLFSNILNLFNNNENLNTRSE